MVAFHFPPNKKISLEEDYLVPLGLGWCTIADGILTADSPLTREQIEKIEAEGFTRADTHWYSITPEPERSARAGLIEAIGQLPVETVPPSRFEALTVSFTKAVQDEDREAVARLGFNMRRVPKPACAP